MCKLRKLRNNNVQVPQVPQLPQLLVEGLFGDIRPASYVKTPEKVGGEGEKRAARALFLFEINIKVCSCTSRPGSLSCFVTRIWTDLGRWYTEKFRFVSASAFRDGKRRLDFFSEPCELLLVVDSWGARRS